MATFNVKEIPSQFIKTYGDEAGPRLQGTKYVELDGRNVNLSDIDPREKFTLTQRYGTDIFGNEGLVPALSSVPFDVSGKIPAGAERLTNAYYNLENPDPRLFGYQYYDPQTNQITQYNRFGEKTAQFTRQELKNLGGVFEAIGDVAKSPIGQIAIAVALPGIGEALLPSILAAGVPAALAPAVATGLASATVSVAQGVPLEKAIENAAISSIVQTGSTDAAKYMVNTGSTPAVANALASVGGSIASTAAKGGSADDILKNATGALVGSGVATAAEAYKELPASEQALGKLTPSARALGTGAATLATTGDAAKALASGAGQSVREDVIRGQQEEAMASRPAVEPKTPSKTAVSTPVDPTQTPPLAQPAITPETPVAPAPQTGTIPEQITQPSQTPDQQAAFDRQIMDIMAQPETPVAAAPETPAFDTGRPLSTVEVKGKQDVTAGEPVISDVVTPTPAPAPAAKDTGRTLPKVTVTAKREEEPIITDTVTAEPEAVAPAPAPTPAAEPEKVAEKPVEEETAPEYKPDLFIYGGVRPKMAAGGSQVLAQLLGTAPFGSLLTSGLTGYRGAGEIESSETGKQRRDVWNEASLRLKDALGL